MRIGEIKHIENIQPEDYQHEQEYIMELNEIFDEIRVTKKQKELLKSHYLNLKETYFLEGEKSFNKSYQNIKALGKATKNVLLLTLKRQ